LEAESWNACPSGFPEKEANTTSGSFGGLVFAIVFPLKRIAETQIHPPHSQKDASQTHNPLLTVSHFPFSENHSSALFPKAAGPAMSGCGGCFVDAWRAGFPIRR